jgi:hypothetical protein
MSPGDREILWGRDNLKGVSSSIKTSLGALSYLIFKDSHNRRCKDVVLAIPENRRLESKLRRRILSLERECSTLSPPTCKVYAPAVEYSGWEGTVHSFVFHNFEYARRFKVLNAEKIIPE